MFVNKRSTAGTAYKQVISNLTTQLSNFPR